MGQSGQVDGYTEGRELFVDVGTPAAGALEPLLEPVAQTMLETNAPGCGTQGFVGDVGRPQSKYACLLVSQVAAFPRGQGTQYRTYLLASRINPAVALASRRRRRHIKAFVDDRQVAVVVQYTFVSRVTCEDRNPEVYVGLQFGRQGKILGGRRG